MGEMVFICVSLCAGISIASQTNESPSGRAYRSSLAPRMAAEASFYARELRLPEALPIKSTAARINPPSAGGLGHVETDSFFYSFPGSDTKPLTNGGGFESFLEPGKVAYVMCKIPFAFLKLETGAGPATIQRELAKLPTQIDTNSAYLLATQWLGSVDVAIEKLEARYQPAVAQQIFVEAGTAPFSLSNAPTCGSRTLLPVFDITWGGDADSSPPVWVQINGATKSLIHIRMEDTRFSKRPPIVVTNAASSRPASPRPGASSASPKLGVTSQYQSAATSAMIEEARFLRRNSGCPFRAIQPLRHWLPLNRRKAAE